MTCPKCGRDNTPGSQFCTQCWTSLAPPAAYGMPPPGPYPQAYPPQSPYAPPGPGQPYPGAPYLPGPAVAPQASTRAVMALVLGVSGMFMPCVFLPIAAIVIGRLELNAIARGESPRSGETFARVGFIMGIVFTVFVGVATCFWLFFIVLGVLAPQGFR